MSQKIKHFINAISWSFPFVGVLSATLLAISTLRTLPTKASVTTPVSVTVPSSCSFSADADTHSATITSGLLEELDGITLTSICNGAYDSQILAIGFANDTAGNTTLSSTTDTINTLDNCSPISPSSCWSMKVTGLGTDTYPFTPQNNYDTYKSIPEKETLIAKTELKTEANPKSTLKTTYNIYTTTTQPAGTYTGKVKYTLTTTVSPVKTFEDAFADAGKVKHNNYYAMQDTSANICASVMDFATTTLVDLRDNNTYTVAKINGVCWMTQNLRFVGDADTYTMTLSPTTSNVDAEKTVEYYSLDASDPTYAGHCEHYEAAENSYYYPCVKDSGSNITGAWYNFAAATAGYISGAASRETSTYDICPKNWHLPTGPFSTLGTDGYSVFQSSEFDAQVPANESLAAFNAVTGGQWYDGVIHSVSALGRWWSATAATNRGRYALNFENLYFVSKYYGRSRAFFVRCVRTS